MYTIVQGKNGDKRVQRSIYVYEKMWAEIGRIARIDGLPRQDWIRDVLLTALRSHEANQPEEGVTF